MDEDENLLHEFNADHGQIMPEIEKPRKTGYDFLSYSEDISELVITKNLKIIAYFTPKLFTVTFRVHGTVSKTESVAYKRAAPAPSVEVEGYEFIGWDVDFTEVTENLEVNAILEAKDYQIILNGNGGLVEEEEIHTLSFAYESTIRVDLIPTRKGYHFEGWYNNESGRAMSLF